MKAAVYYGPQDIRCSNIADSVIREGHTNASEGHSNIDLWLRLCCTVGALDPIMTKGQSQTGHELVGGCLTQEGCGSLQARRSA